MKKITIEEARTLFLSHPARYVSQEQPEIYYDNFSGEIEIVPYLTCGCLAVRSGTCWHIHALSEDADFISAVVTVNQQRENETESIMAFTWGNPPEPLENYVGSYKFARNPIDNYADNEIRPLTAEDAQAIEKCCAYDTEDDYIGKNMASDFIAYSRYINSPRDTVLGLFEGNDLAGIVQSAKNSELNIAVINIYVNRKYRKKGYAKRLLSAICTTDQNTVYCYARITPTFASPLLDMSWDSLMRSGWKSLIKKLPMLMPL